MGNGGIGTCFSRKKESNESFILRNINGELILESVVLQGILTEESNLEARGSGKKSGVRTAGGKENRPDAAGFARSTWSVLKSEGSAEGFLSPEESAAFTLLANSNFRRVSQRQIAALGQEIDTKFAELGAAYHFELIETSIKMLFENFEKTANFLAREAREALTKPDQKNSIIFKISAKSRAPPGPRARGRLSRFFHESEDLKALRGLCLASQADSLLAPLLDRKNFEAENEVQLYQFFDAVEPLGLGQNQSVVYRWLIRPAQC